MPGVGGFNFFLKNGNNGKKNINLEKIFFSLFKKIVTIANLKNYTMFSGPMGPIFGQGAQPESKGIKAKLSNSCRGEVARKDQVLVAECNVAKTDE